MPEAAEHGYLALSRGITALLTDYGGQSVHVAARIGAAATAGEVLVSRETLNGIETAFRLSEPRVTSLKGFGEPMGVVSVDWR